MSDARDKLRNDFPEMFKSCYDLSIGDGWVPILRSICEAAKSLGEKVEFAQCKEKFGGARLYTNVSSDEVDKWIRDAEAECWKVCEDCGTKDTVKRRDGGWIRTLCDACNVLQRKASSK